MLSLAAMLALSAGYLISTAVNGGTAEGWAGLSKVAVAILFVLLPEKPKPEKIALSAGLLVAVLGILAYSEWFTFPSMVAAGRIFGVFQYANAAGIFLAVCAFVTRLSDKAERATPMEAALILTQSVGALAVYATGWLFYWYYHRKLNISFHLLSFLLSAFTAAAVIAVVRYTPAPWLAPLIFVIYAFIGKRAQNAILLQSEKKMILVAACAMICAFIAGLFYLRGIQPLLTYAERIIQITDGLSAMLSHPLGIGPGGWAFHVMWYQSAQYSARLIHSSFIQVGVDGGILALCGAAALIIIWIHRCRKSGVNRYFAASAMILVHSLMDFTLSYLSLVMLLIIMMQAAQQEAQETQEHSRLQRTAAPKTKAKNNRRSAPNTSCHATGQSNRIRALIAIPIALFTLLIIPETVKNRVMWLADDGQPEAALRSLESGFVLPRDTRAAIMRMSYAQATGDYAVLDKAFDDIYLPNAEAYHFKAMAEYERGEYDSAAQYALQCIERSRYAPEGYRLLDEIAGHLPDTRQTELTQQAQALLNDADEKAHILAKYIAK